MGPAVAAPMADLELSFFPMAVAAEPSDILVGGDVVAEKDLGTMAGGIGLGDVQMNTADNTSNTSNNTVSGNVQTGTISNTAVHDVSGFSTILLNTGNNVVMQSVTQVNIILK